MNNIALTTYNNGPATTSRNVADVFGKRHDAVLRAYDNLDCSTNFRQHNFVLTDYISPSDPSGKKNREIVMTKNGFTFLAMGFTGKQAAAFKEAYIKQFDAMEQRLKEPTTNNDRLLDIIANLSHALALGSPAKQATVASKSPRISGNPNVRNIWYLKSKNRYLIEIPPPLISQLGFKGGQSVELTVEDNVLTITNNKGE